MVDKSKIAIGIYNSAIQKRGMSPQEAFEELVKRLYSMKVPLKEVQSILGRNANQMDDFNKAFIGQVSTIYQSLEKKPLDKSQIKNIKKIVSILYLRHLQQKKYEEEDNYVSFERLQLSAEDYNVSNLHILTISYFDEYTNEDFSQYSDEIKKIVQEMINTKPTMQELEDLAVKEGFLKQYVESPGRLTNVPVKQQSFAGNQPLKKGGVIRFAPTPNGPLHLGHGRGIAILSDYADKYDMEFILRFDDTDCSKKGSNLPAELNIPNVYDHIIKDFTWIRGKPPDKIIYASDRRNLTMYNTYGRDLIRDGLAYVYYDMGDKNYIYGTSAYENLQMFDELMDMSYAEGENPPFKDAGVLLGIPSDMKTMNRVYNMADGDIIKFVKNWVKDNVYQRKLKSSNIFGYSNTETGTKIMRYQKDQNIRVQQRGEVNWIWPTLNLQSVADDKQEKVTHVIRGLDYDYQKALQSNDAVVLRTIRFQTIMRVLLKAPPVASTQNWGNVSWDGGYTLSTSKLRKMIMEGKLGNQGFLHPDLPTIFALRDNENNWGESFRFYWTRFNLPNALDPQFKTEEYKKLNQELKDKFGSKTELDRFNSKLTKDISKLQQNKTYLAEE